MASSLPEYNHDSTVPFPSLGSHIAHFLRTANHTQIQSLDDSMPAEGSHVLIAIVNCVYHSLTDPLHARIVDYCMTLTHSRPGMISNHHPSEGAISVADITANHSGHIIPVVPYPYGGVDGTAIIGTYNTSECPLLILRKRFKHQASLPTLHMVLIPMTGVIMRYVMLFD
jgi:hypothetical protein